MQIQRGEIVVMDISDEKKADLWMLYSPIQVKLSNHKYIKIPKGFVTDFASVPKIFWSAISPIGKTKLASLIHDYLYNYHIFKREFADKEFLRWLNFLEPNKKIRNKTMYYAVRLFGKKRYERSEQIQ